VTENAVRALGITIGSLLMAAGAACAEPAKDHVAKPGVGQQQPVVLASADRVRTPSVATPQPVSAPAKRPAPRVTTCRCGDPQPEPDAGTQEQ